MPPPLALEPPRFRCVPPVWARGGHAQTIFGHLLSAGAPNVGGERHELELDDGDKLAVRYRRGTSDVVVSMFHGLGGSSDADYVRMTASTFEREGHSVIAANHRGCGEGRGLAAGPYHSGRSEDVARVLRFGREQEPDALHIAIGFSLSGNTLLLAAATEDPRPDAAIAVNPPLDLAASIDQISAGWNRIYDMRFVSRLRRTVRERAEDGLASPPAPIPRLATLRRFDELFTAPVGGFLDAEDYYTRCSAGPHLEALDVPTVIVSAQDDPFIQASLLTGARRSDHVHLHIESHGGHLGYLSRELTPLGDRRWLGAALAHYVEALVERLG